MSKHRHRRTGKRRQPAALDWDPINTAIARAALLPADEAVKFTAPLTQAAIVLKTGHHDPAAQHAAWCNLADALNVAEQLCALGIAPDRLDIILAGHRALGDLHQRHAQRGCWTLRADEIIALEGTDTVPGALDVCRIQLSLCTQGELADAIAATKERMSQALAGNAPRDAVVCVGALGGAAAATMAGEARA